MTGERADREPGRRAGGGAAAPVARADRLRGDALLRGARAASSLLLASCLTDATVTLDATARFQTMAGWEAHHQSGVLEPNYMSFRDTVLNRAVNELGINRIRIEAWSGIEHPDDGYARFRSGEFTYPEWQCRRWATVNDNDDPHVIDPAGYQFSQIDEAIENVVLPLMRLLEARGEKLYLNLTYNAFTRQCPETPYIHHDNIEEYAEFALAAFLHLRDRWGIVPDAWEVILEPEHTPWRGPAIGAALVAAGDRLKEHGFTPDFVAPSTTDMTRSIRFFDQMVTVPRVLDYISELSYHRYGGVSEASLRAIAERGARYGIRTAMLEHIGSGHVELFDDLTIGNVSAWQQFALAYRTRDDGAQYYVIEADGSVRMGERTRWLLQYFRYIRPGAVRIGAASSAAAVAPVAFEHPDGGTVVVVRTSGRTRLEVRGLPPGRYGVTYTTRSVTVEDGGALDVGPDGMLATMAPRGAVLTVYPHAGGLTAIPEAVGRRVW